VSLEQAVSFCTYKTDWMMFCSGQRKRERYAALEAQASSNPGSADSSASPDSSEDMSSSEAAILASSSGVSLAGFQDNFLYPDTPLTTGDNTFGLQDFLNSPGVDLATGMYQIRAHLP
jgi:hypothetical protein